MIIISIFCNKNFSSQNATEIFIGIKIQTDAETSKIRLTYNTEQGDTYLIDNFFHLCKGLFAI